jgi:hypothetical protein
MSKGIKSVVKTVAAPVVKPFVSAPPPPPPEPPPMPEPSPMQQAFPQKGVPQQPLPNKGMPQQQPTPSGGKLGKRIRALQPQPQPAPQPIPMKGGIGGLVQQIPVEPYRWQDNMGKPGPNPAQANPVKGPPEPPSMGGQSQGYDSYSPFIYPRRTSYLINDKLSGQSGQQPQSFPIKR